MIQINSYLQNLKTSYLFDHIQTEKEKYPHQDWINLGIGDVTQPLSLTVARAICKATNELTQEPTLRGYGPSQGYSFLRKAICENEYAHLGFEPDEIFIGNGAKGDLVGLADLFSSSSVVALQDPTYPVYFESNFISGKKHFVYLPSTLDNHWVCKPPEKHCDLIYLCSPNNPTGAAFTKQELSVWVNYAKREGAIIVYDAAYKAFISSDEIPRSIFEIEGAREVAVEVSSFSKTAGFTNLRCSYTTISKSCPLYPLWKRRIDTTFGGVPYPVQKGAEAVFSPQGKEETSKTLNFYRSNAQSLREGLRKNGIVVCSKNHSPYLWCQTPGQMKSWDFFHKLLKDFQMVVIPGAGFGPSGEGFFRVSSFATQKTVEKALLAFDKLFQTA